LSEALSRTWPGSITRSSFFAFSFGATFSSK